MKRENSNKEGSQSLIIHPNPLRAHIVKTIEELDCYLFWCHRIIVGKAKHLWTEVDYVLLQFGSETKRPGRVSEVHVPYIPLHILVHEYNSRVQLFASLSMSMNPPQGGPERSSL